MAVPPTVTFFRCARLGAPYVNKALADHRVLWRRWRPTSAPFARSPAACAGHAPLRLNKRSAQLACMVWLKHGPVSAAARVSARESAPAKGLRANEALVGHRGRESARGGRARRAGCPSSWPERTRGQPIRAGADKRAAGHEGTGPFVPSVLNVTAGSLTWLTSRTPGQAEGTPVSAATLGTGGRRTRQSQHGTRSRDRHGSSRASLQSKD